MKKTAILDATVQDRLSQKLGVEVQPVLQSEHDLTSHPENYYFLIIYKRFINWGLLEGVLLAYFYLLGYKIFKDLLPNDEKGLCYIMTSEWEKVLIRCVEEDQNKVLISVEKEEPTYPSFVDELTPV